MVRLFGAGLPNVPFPLQVPDQAQAHNMLQFAEMFNRFSNLAITRFNWKNLPKSVNERFLNIALYFYGKAAFFYDNDLGFMALPFTDRGQYNVYYQPTVIEAFSINYRKTLQPDEYVEIRNNPTCTPTSFPVFTYVTRLADILRTIDVLLFQKKHPIMIECDERQRLSINNMIKQVADNEVLVIGNKRFGETVNQMNVLKIDGGYSIEELWDSFYNLYNYLLSLLGIDTPAVSKSERLLVDEVNANNMVTEMNTETQLKEYNEALALINAKWGLDISVEARSIYDEDMPGDVRESSAGGGDDG